MVKRTKSLTYTMMFPVINMESSNIFLRPLSYGDLVTLILHISSDGDDSRGIRIRRNTEFVFYF